jgi:hypothetical protein
VLPHLFGGDFASLGSTPTGARASARRPGGRGGGLPSIVAMKDVYKLSEHEPHAGGGRATCTSSHTGLDCCGCTAAVAGGRAIISGCREVRSLELVR